VSWKEEGSGKGLVRIDVVLEDLREARAALAEPAPVEAGEPVAWVKRDGGTVTTAIPTTAVLTVFDWAYSDGGVQRYARTPETAALLKSKGVKLTPVYTIEEGFAPAPHQVPIYRHKKRGTTYRLVGFGKMQAEHWVSGRGSVDMREVAIYQSTKDPAEIWVRPREEFEDGRFEQIAPAQEPGK
jgi:hypothetical protein